MHPVNEVAARIHDALTRVDDVDPVFMATLDKAAALVELARAEARVTELRLRVLATAADVADRDGARDAGAWVAHATRQRRGDAASDLRLAHALAEGGREALASALRAGEVSVEQAKVIARRVDDLPADVPAAVVARAEEALVAYAGRFDPSALHRLGKKILDTVAPEIAEDHEARALADLEASARQRQRLVMRAQGDGTTRLTAVLPDPVAARLATYLHAFTNPRRDAHGGAPLDHERDGVHDGPGDTVIAGEAIRRVPYPRRAAEAFAQLLEALDPSRLPIHGGEATTVVVTMSLESLKKELAVGSIDVGLPGDALDTLTAGEVRRLACNAHIIPAVLDGASNVLDFGRRRRLHSGSQRLALGLTQKHCRAEGCQVPASWCEAHHRTPWSRGGKTDLADSDLLCNRHHHLVHDPRYDVDSTPTGYRFHLRRQARSRDEGGSR